MAEKNRYKLPLTPNGVNANYAAGCSQSWHQHTPVTPHRVGINSSRSRRRSWRLRIRRTHTHTCLTALFQDYPGEPVPERWNQSGFYWRKRQWVAVASAGPLQVCTSLQTDNHASTPPLSFFTGWMPFLPPNQQCQSTENSKRHSCHKILIGSCHDQLSARLWVACLVTWSTDWLAHACLTGEYRLRCCVARGRACCFVWRCSCVITEWTLFFCIFVWTCCVYCK